MNRNEEEWNRHGSYQWTYFDETVKKRICYYFSERLKGRNLDLGGGWYLYYPNSVVVDLSGVCLDYNIAEEKIKFDLDDLGKGEKLPFSKNSFDSATMVSVWQYLNHPNKVVDELERILKPGSNFYIINGEHGHGVREFVVNEYKPGLIKKYFERKDYDTLVENIPVRGSPDEFKSVCVATHYKTLFGERMSFINNKEEQESWNFNKKYKEYEVKKRTELLEKLSRYPVTKYSKKYVKRVELFSKEFHEKSGLIPLVFLENSIPPEIHMLTKDSLLSNTIVVIGEEEKKHDDSCLYELRDKHNLFISQYYGYFNHESINQIIKYCSNFDECEYSLKRIINFLTAIPLNSFSKNLQKRIRSSLNVEDLEKRITKTRARGYAWASSEHKQRTKIQKLIERRKKIWKNKDNIIGHKFLHYKKYLPYFKEHIY